MGISSYEMQSRALGVTQKTVRFMDHRIRPRHEDWIVSQNERRGRGGSKPSSAASLRTCTKKKENNVGTGGAGKPPYGYLCRKGDAGTSKVQASLSRTLTGQPLQTKALRQCRARRERLWPMLHYRVIGEYQHEVINHVPSNMRGEVHAPTGSKTSSPLKRTIKGTHVSVEPLPPAGILTSKPFDSMSATMWYAIV